jgi:hypothetical protein
MKKLHFLAILVALSGFAQAGERDMVPGRFETSGGGGIAFGDDTAGLATFGFSAGASRFVSVTGDYFYSADSIQVGKEKVKGRQNDFLGGLNVHLPVKGNAVPYLLGGVGITSAKVAIGKLAITDSKPQVNLGGGVRMYTGKRFGVKLEARWAKAFDLGTEGRVTISIFSQFGK